MSSTAFDLAAFHGARQPKALHPAGDGPPDLMRRIFLDVMAPRNGYLSQRWKTADEGQILLASEDRAGLGLKKQLLHMTRFEPVRRGSHYCSHIGRLAIDGDFPWPCQRRPPSLARLAERPPVPVHLLGREGTQYG